MLVDDMVFRVGEMFHVDPYHEGLKPDRVVDGLIRQKKASLDAVC